MENSYPRYKTLTDKELEKKDLKKLELGIYKIEWGEDNSFNWVCEEEHANQTIAHHNERIIGAVALVNKHHNQYFLSIDLEHVIQVSSSKDGRLVSRLTGHTDKIIGVIELPNGNLLSASLDGTIKHWNLKSFKCIATIESNVNSIDDIGFSNVNSIDDIDFASSVILITKDESGTKLWQLSGKLLVELTGFTKSVEYIRQFKSGTWIVKPKNENPSQWSAKGELQHKYNFSFSPKADVHELDNLQLLIQGTKNILQLWSKEGELLEKHVKDVGITELFGKLVKANVSTDNWIDSHRNGDDYPLTCNSLGLGDFYLASGKKEIENQQLKFKRNSDNRTIWDFFYRPKERSIKTALKDNIDVALKAEKKLTPRKSKAEKQIEQHKGKRKFAKFTALFFLFLSITVGSIGIAGLVLTNNFDMIINSISPIIDNMLDSKGTLKNVKLLNLQIAFAIGAGSLLLISLLWFIRNKRQKTKQLSCTGNLYLVEVMINAFDKLIEIIKTHRSEVLNNLPSYQDDQLFNGDKVNALINQKIKNEIQQIAMQECDVDESDITYQSKGDKTKGNKTKGKAIILQDWSFIQENRPSRLNVQNEQALRFDIKGQLVSAVRSIQYIFLTEEKLDVFSTYYDFIADKHIGRRSNSFYYKDVSNVARREVYRPLFGREVTGSEITLSAASGDEISLTLMNEESIRGLGEDFAKDDVQSTDNCIDSAISAVNEFLESEAEEIKAYYLEEITQAEKESSTPLVKNLKDSQQKLQDYLEVQRDIANNYEPDESIAKSQSKDSEVDLAFKNIRAQIKSHKKSEAA